MPLYFKKGSFGRMVETADTDQEAIEVRMDCDEWTDWCTQLDQTKVSLRHTQHSVQNLTREQEESKRRIDDLNQQLRKVQADYAQLVQDMEQSNKDKDAAIAALDLQKELNKGLLRIVKERSNAARGIVPKKANNGYIVLYCNQYTYRYTIKRTFEEWRKYNPSANRHNFQRVVHREAKVWHSAIQTPYPATLPFDSTQNQFFEDSHEIMRDLGITTCVAAAQNGSYDLVKKDKCGLYKWAFRSNMKSGLWEIDWYTTGPLTVPPEYFPPQKKAKK